MPPQEAGPQPDDEQLISDLEALKIYVDPLRRRILKELGGPPRTVHQVAEALNVPFTRLYYQFHLLEHHRLIRLIETRALSGAIAEKYYQTTARMYVIDRRLLTIGGEGESPVLDFVLHHVLDATGHDVRRGVRAGEIDLALTPPEPTSLLLRRGIFHLTPDKARYFYDRLRELALEMHQASQSEDGRNYALVLGFYPTLFARGLDDGSAGADASEL